MRRDRLREMLERLRRGEAEVEEALRRLSAPRTERLGFAEIDHHRSLRLGHPEAVYCPGKKEDELVEICRRMSERGEGFLATRADAGQMDRLAEAFPDAELSRRAGAVHLPPEDGGAPAVRGSVLVVCAGTADVAVAEEARFTARCLGNPVEIRYDVGVAAIQRVLDAHEELGESSVVIVVAGMDGALPSVVGGLVAAPVVAVPTSAGYGASFGGAAALLTMLNSCAPGVTVVNIDNGYGAACAATRINQHRPPGADQHRPPEADA